MKLEGTISKFGGPCDTGMSPSEGTSFYTHEEADLRPDLFYPKSSDPLQGVGHRLRNLTAFYCALNFATSYDRELLKRSIWKIKNQQTGQFCVAQPTDRGPRAKGRLVDVSDVLFNTLRLADENCIVTVEEISTFGFIIGPYGSPGCFGE